VDFELTARELSHVDEEGRRVVEPGAYKVWVGGGQPETQHDVPGLQEQFEIRASETPSPASGI
jgi:beta-glucosidase